MTADEVRAAFSNIGLRIPDDTWPDAVQAFYRIIWNSGFLDCGGCACNFFTGQGARHTECCMLDLDKMSLEPIVTLHE